MRRPEDSEPHIDVPGESGAPAFEPAPTVRGALPPAKAPRTDTPGIAPQRQSAKPKGAATNPSDAGSPTTNTPVPTRAVTAAASGIGTPVQRAVPTASAPRTDTPGSPPQRDLAKPKG
ncbi:hypothetical protein ACFXGI_27390, partial [Streptomyces sp. NPDC059355]